jgi:alkenylglycerophosphocholine hydrolase
MFLMLRPTLPSDFVVPVIIYCIAIALMAAKALGRSGKQFATQGIAVASFGAVSFMISDSVLSYSLFKANFPGSRLVVRFTYYLAQLLIALSACDFYGGVAVKKD